MNKPGYDLPVLPVPANMPNAKWASDLWTSTQAVMDDQYKHGPGGLDNFYAQADGWLQTQIVLRNNSKDPKGFRPESFRMAIPRRQVVTFTENGALDYTLAPADPTVAFPVIPPYVDTAPTGPAFPMTPAPDLAGMLGAIMAKLMSIEQRLGKLGV